MSVKDSVYSENFRYAFFKTAFVPSMRPSFCGCLASIFLNFFFAQFRACLLPGRIPVSRADHPLDERIPFVPSWIAVYFDFVNFWVRMLSFFLRRYRRRAYKPVGEFIQSMGNLYAYAAQVYRKNLSTTKRPFYIARPLFFLVHLVDPHLMCIPSLHVMIAIHTYTMFAVIARQLGAEEKLKDQIDEMRQGALSISRSVLFVKQHSVNCIPASLYAMTCFSPELFPPEEGERFTERLFSPAPALSAPHLFRGRVERVHPAAAPLLKLPKEDLARIKSHTLNLYRQFLCEGKNAESWDEPLLNFLRSLG